MSTKNNDSLIEASVIARAKNISNVSTDKDFAVILGISSADFGQRKKRETLLPLITRWAIKQNVDLNFLLKGYSTKSESVLDPDPEISELMEGARRILTSGHPIACDALAQNIRCFDQAIAVEKRADESEQEIKDMKEDMEFIKQEFAKLKIENQRLDEEEEAPSSDEKAA